MDKLKDMDTLAKKFVVFVSDNPVAIALFAVVVLVIITSMSRSRENFSLGDVFGKIKDIGKKVGNVAKDTFNKAKSVVAKDTYKAQFVNREAYSFGWACPPGSVDYGREDRQCLISEFGPMLWRPPVSGTGDWAWSCPRGTTPNNTEDWEKKCVKGFSGAKYINNSWKCFDTETNTGKNWENSDWYEGHRQCKADGVATVFTTRENIGGSWKCPDETKDTGKDWKQTEKMADGRVVDVGSYQCQRIGG